MNISPLNDVRATGLWTRVCGWKISLLFKNFKVSPYNIQISHHYKAHHFTKNIPINTTYRHILKMPNSSETTVFTRTGNTAGIQESVQKLADEWKGKGIKIETGPNKITFITPPGGQRASDYSVKNFRARMEKDGL
jgi:hypothetical protein